MDRTVIKSSVLLILLFIATLPAISQNIEIDKRLEKGHDIAYLTRLQNNSPLTLEILNYELDHAWFIAEGDILQKAEGFDYLYFKNISTGKKSPKRVENIDVKNINISEFFYDRALNNRTYYRVGNSNTVIGFYSLTEIAEMFNKEKGRSNE